jgi:hypothetical protein
VGGERFFSHSNGFVSGEAFRNTPRAVAFTGEQGGVAMDQRPRNPNLTKEDYIDRYHDDRGSGVVALLLGCAALLIVGWLLLSTRVEQSPSKATENAPTAIGPAYRAPAAPNPSTASPTPSPSKSSD